MLLDKKVSDDLKKEVKDLLPLVRFAQISALFSFLRSMCLFRIFCVFIVAFLAERAF